MATNLPSGPIPRRPAEIQRAKMVSAIGKELPPAEQQLLLLREFEETPSPYTNLLEFFDSVPKFLQTPTTSRTEGTQLEIARFGFVWHDARCESIINPVLIDTLEKDGSRGRKEVLPGPREQTIYRVVRKMASDPKVPKRIKGDDVVLTTSFYQIRTWLAEIGHELRTADIREALQVLSIAKLKVFNLDAKKELFSDSYLKLTYLSEVGDSTGERSRVEIGFNRLAMTAIINGLYDRIDYGRLMGLNPLAAWIYELLTRAFRQAGAECGYTLTLSRVMRESGLPVRKELRTNLRYVRAALSELKTQGVLQAFPPTKEELEYGPPTRGRRSIADVKWTLYPSDAVIKDIRVDNAAKRDRGQRHLELGDSGIT